MAQIGTHRRGQREVLGRRAVITGPGQREAESEPGVVIARAGVHDPAEAARRLGVASRVELRPAERLQDAPRVGLGDRRALQQLRGRGRAAPPQQVQTAPVKRIYVFLPGSRPIGRARHFAGTGILAA